MRFMQDIESHTIIYLRSLLATRAIDDPDVATFLACWVYEETFHGLALQRFLEAAGTPVGERPLPRGQEPWPKRLEAAATAMVSRAWPDFCAVHMTWGAINELTTLTGYRRLAALADHPVLDGSARAHRARRVATLLLLLSPGRDPHAAPRGRAGRALPGRPLLGAGGQRGPARRRAALPGRAISSAGPEGRAAARKVDETIRRLPGFETVQLLESWMDRHVGTPATRYRAPTRRTQWPPTTTERPRISTPPAATTGPTRPRPFTRAERDSVTILFGGLHWRVERILQAVLESGGHKAQVLPVATKDDLLTGREVADIGQCCPTSFTTGNLVNFLKKEAKATSAEDVNKKFVYLTAGSCGACRFGQYHQSYELALRNSGLDAFRMFLLAQDQLDQKAAMGDGLDLNLPVTLGCLWAIFCTDLVQDLEYQVRPYEVVPGPDRGGGQGVDGASLPGVPEPADARARTGRCSGS